MWLPLPSRIQILKPEYFDYLAHYVVVKRVSMEDNFQELYLEFIERVGEKTLSKKILEQTTRSIRALISSDKVRSPSLRFICPYARSEQKLVSVLFSKIWQTGLVCKLWRVIVPFATSISLSKCCCLKPMNLEN